MRSNRNYTSLNRTVAPTEDPISTDEAKDFMKVDTDDEDELITSLISASTRRVEAYLNRQLITATYQLFVDDWCGKSKDAYSSGVYNGTKDILANNNSTTLELPFSPLQSVTHIKTYDDSDTATTYADSNYFVKVTSGEAPNRGSITIRSGSSAPTGLRVKDAIEIEFVAGYGDSGVDVPSAIRNAIKMDVQNMYDNRVSCEMTELCKELLQPYRIYNIG